MLGHLAQRGKIVTLSSETRTFSDPFSTLTCFAKSFLPSLQTSRVTLSSKTRTISDPFLLRKPAHSPTPFPPLFHPYLLCKKFSAIVTNIKNHCNHIHWLLPYSHSPHTLQHFLYCSYMFQRTLKRLPLPRKPTDFRSPYPRLVNTFIDFCFWFNLFHLKWNKKIGFSFSLHCRTLTHPLSHQHSLSFPSEATLPYVYLTANENPLFIFCFTILTYVPRRLGTKGEILLRSVPFLGLRPIFRSNIRFRYLSSLLCLAYF